MKKSSLSPFGERDRVRGIIKKRKNPLTSVLSPEGRGGENLSLIHQKSDK
jgi:hypothetical protein